VQKSRISQNAINACLAMIFFCFWPLSRPFNLNADERPLYPSIPDVASRVGEVFCAPQADMQAASARGCPGYSFHIGPYGASKRPRAAASIVTPHFDGRSKSFRASKFAYFGFRGSRACIKATTAQMSSLDKTSLYAGILIST
jgi:hypothetical protein